MRCASGGSARARCSLSICRRTFISSSRFSIAVPLGILVGFAAAGLSRLMYGLEDAFEHFCGRMRIHWMWWPAIGGIGIGIGGYFFPRGLGVGYDNIAELLRGNAPVALLLGLVIAKSLMWAFSLSSGTSGGVLAPLLMIGAAIGEVCCASRASSRTDTGSLGAHGHGSNAFRRTRGATHSGALFAGAHARAPSRPAARACLHGVLSRHLARHAALDLDRKAESPWLSSIARIRCRSAGAGDCVRSDD